MRHVPRVICLRVKHGSVPGSGSLWVDGPGKGISEEAEGQGTKEGAPQGAWGCLGPASPLLERAVALKEIKQAMATNRRIWVVVK